MIAYKEEGVWLPTRRKVCDCLCGGRSVIAYKEEGVWLLTRRKVCDCLQGGRCVIAFKEEVCDCLQGGSVWLPTRRKECDCLQGGRCVIAYKEEGVWLPTWRKERHCLQGGRCVIAYKEVHSQEVHVMSTGYIHQKVHRVSLCSKQTLSNTSCTSLLIVTSFLGLTRTMYTYGVHCIYVKLARTVYIHRIWPYIWRFPCQKYCICTVYIGFWPTLYIRSLWQGIHQTHGHIRCMVYIIGSGQP